MTASPRFLVFFLIGPFSCLQLKMTYIRAWMSSKFGQIRPRTTELASSCVRKKSRCLRVFSAVFDRILFILAGNEDIHKS